ncbi:hypothetical protein FRX31_030157 [Thalictrum thalictroides]|uniref:Uncharacterized protein n=1 Tax=Thalictrum thalictroides TaxID=46969 RepID=A0A7J6V5J0_THATH|nr:hypothetical protein FRX31_030157 [Thalictrum thalictroides]
MKKRIDAASFSKQGKGVFEKGPRPNHLGSWEGYCVLLKMDRISSFHESIPRSGAYFVFQEDASATCT